MIIINIKYDKFRAITLRKTGFKTTSKYADKNWGKMSQRPINPILMLVWRVYGLGSASL
jgi:hypothetical protein